MTRIVLSGSMKFREEIIAYGNKLKELGYDVVIPRECIDINMKKVEASRLHFDEISKDDTDILLAVNYTKNGYENYIGANTFAEIAMAWYLNKRVYLLNDIYKPFAEELLAWKVIPLNGYINKIV